MKVTITAETSEQTIEITRELDAYAPAERLAEFEDLLTAAVSDVRRAAGLVEP